MKIITLDVKQIRIYEIDAIPFALLSTVSTIGKIVDVFSFIIKESPLAGDKLSFTNGEIKIKNTNVAINSLIFEPRRILLSVKGDSKIADSIYQKIHDLINAISKSSELSQELIKSEETACVAKLNAEFFDIFDRKFVDFLNSALKSTSRDYAKSYLKSIRLGFFLSYEVLEKNLFENSITMGEKPFVIEPREGTPLKKNIFYTMSPNDSDTHIKIIQDFEKSFRQKQKAIK